MIFTDALGCPKAPGWAYGLKENTSLEENKSVKKVMMTVFKIVLILIAVVVVGVVALILFALHKESNYYKYTEAVGEIEQKYTAFGDKEVSCQEYDAMMMSLGNMQFGIPLSLKAAIPNTPLSYLQMGQEVPCLPINRS